MCIPPQLNIEMTENSENDDEQNEDDGITININSDVSDENDSEDTEVQNTTSDDEGDILDEDGTVAIEDPQYSGSVRLVGTVHVSKETRNRVVDTVQEERPDVVAIELDEDRLFEMFKRGADVVGGEAEQQDTGGFGLRDLIRKQQEKQFDTDDVLKPGEADMIPAVDEAVSLRKEVALIDMSVDQLKANVKENAYDDGSLDLEILDKSFGEVTDALKGFVRSRSEIADKVQDEGIGAVVEHLENASLDEVKGQMDPLREIAPEVIEALIDERDRYMAGRLHWLRQNGYDAVGVMGRGHLQGVYEYLQNPSEIPDQYVVEPDWYEYETIEIN